MSACDMDVMVPSQLYKLNDNRPIVCTSRGSSRQGDGLSFECASGSPAKYGLRFSTVTPVQKSPRGIKRAALLEQQYCMDLDSPDLKRQKLAERPQATLGQEENDIYSLIGKRSRECDEQQSASKRIAGF